MARSNQTDAIPDRQLDEQELASIAAKQAEIAGKQLNVRRAAAELEWRKWALEQAVKVGSDPNQLVSVAAQILHFALEPINDATTNVP